MPPPVNEWEAYRTGARLWLKNPKEGTAALIASAKKIRSGVIMEGLGLLQLTAGNAAGGIESFRAARQYYKHPDDIIRASIHEIIQLRGMNEATDALALARRQLAAYPKSPAADVIRMFESELDVASSTRTAPAGARRP